MVPKLFPGDARLRDGKTGAAVPPERATELPGDPSPPSLLRPPGAATLRGLFNRAGAMSATL